MNSGIYVIKNKTNDKVYVGSSKSLNKRISQHLSSLRNNNHENDYLQKSFSKYGEKSFEFKILVKIQEDNLCKAEQYWIDYYKSYKEENGYNLIRFANRVKFTEEHKENLSESQKIYAKNNKEKLIERLPDDTSGKSHPLYGKERPEKVRDKISKTKKEKDTPQEVIDRILDNHCDNSGENHGQAKLNDKKVKEIMELLEKTNMTQREIAEKFNICRSNISDINNGKIWTHITNND